MFRDFIHFAVNSPLGISGCVLIIVCLFFFWPRGGGWLIAFFVLLFLALWAFNTIYSAADRAQRDVSARVDNAFNAIANSAPDRLKVLWQKIKDKLPSPKEKVGDEACEYMGVAILCDSAKAAKRNLEQLKADLHSTEQICKASPAVVAQFGEEAAVMFCNGNPFQNAQRAIDEIAKSAVQGTTGPLSGFLVTDTQKLDTKPYFDCLYEKLIKNPRADASSCSSGDPHLWRLCVEYHMQLPHEKLGQPPAPLDVGIIACRKSALGL